MKKLLAMILMASFALSAVATEVTLICKKSDGSEPETWGFDEANGTVTHPTDGKISTKQQCKDSGKYCREYFITPTEFGMVLYMWSDGKPTKKLSISRMDGAYRWAVVNGSSNSVDTGTCVPFKQAF